jgi:O-antigen ligase
LSQLLSELGVVAAACAAAAAILLPRGRTRAALMALAVVLVPILILGDQWHTRQVVDVREPLGLLILLAGAALAAAGALALLFRRWPLLLPLAIVAALPFRIPLHAGGESANLLVPLYLVIAGGVLTAALRDRASAAPSSPAGRAVRLLPFVLAGFVVLYALQAVYSEDFSKGLQNVCFFFVPFTVAFALLGDCQWDRRLLRLVLWVVAIEAVAFVVVGSVEYFSHSLFWNDQVIRSNQFHTYFRVNSVFWDPNIYGRDLALTIVVATAALLWSRDRRTVALLTALVTVLWLGLFPTFSQSSFAALLGGLAVLAALRWSMGWTAATVCVAAVAVVGFLAATGAIDVNKLNPDTGGRANLISGGAKLFAKRPGWGYGSGSFPLAYRRHAATGDAPVSVSHTEPVTVAAEQGVIGLLAYAALLAVALWTLAAGTLRTEAVGRAAVLAAFVALLVHTMAYAGFFEDPLTWVLLAVGGALAAQPAAPPRRLAD